MPPDTDRCTLSSASIGKLLETVQSGRNVNIGAMAGSLPCHIVWM